LQVCSVLSAAERNVDLHDRIAGLLLGSFIGDALGGPVEFQDRAKISALPDPPKVWRDDEILDETARAVTGRRLRLRPYSPLRPVPEPYGHWTADAAPGTVTDDSRHKLILLDALGKTESSHSWPFDARALAQAYLAWPESETVRSRAGYPQLCAEWLEQWFYATRWIVGERDTDKSLPPERLWNGLPTCCGQMVLLPLAAVLAGRPVEAYRAAYHLAYFDNGWGRDLNAALVAALATALATPVEKDAPGRTWQPILTTLRQTDPYRYGQIPWVQRSVDRWLDMADRLVRESDGRPARLFAALEREFQRTIKWEAQVPFVVTFAVLALADYDPLAALQLSIEWGHDTDSYAQLVGAFVGAVHGTGLFDPAMRKSVTDQLTLDYDADVDHYAALLEALHARARKRELFRFD
jgi:ADP-ribosylglycohydrolase